MLVTIKLLDNLLDYQLNGKLDLERQVFLQMKSKLILKPYSKLLNFKTDI